MLASSGTRSPTETTESVSVEDERAIRKQQVALGYRLFASFGWGDDGAGHITGRDPELTDHMWLLPYGFAFGEATADRLVLVGPDGEIARGDSSGYNRTAFNIHHPIHRARPDVVGAVHTHTAYGTPLAALCAPLAMVSQEACAFHRDQALYTGDNLDVITPDGGEPIAAALADNRLVIMANHGLLTVGTSVASALAFFVLAERSAEVQMKAPEARVVSDEAAEIVHGSIGTEANGSLVFDFLVRSRIGGPAEVL